MKKKRPTKKPTLSTADAVRFAEAAPKAVRTHQKPNPADTIADTEKPAKADTGGKSGLVPDGDKRISANVSEEVHLRLKIAAARQGTTIGELIEDLVTKHLDN